MTTITPAFRRLPPSPPPFITSAVERLLDNEALRKDLTDAEYGPLLDRAVKAIEAAGARLGPGAAFDARVEGILQALKVDVKRTGAGVQMTANGSAAYALLQKFARGMNATLDQREAELLVRRTFASPMNAANLATLQELYRAPAGALVTFQSPVKGEAAVSLGMTAAAYRVLAEAVGFVAQ